MHLQFYRGQEVLRSGSVIYAYFEPGAVAVVFESDEEGSKLGGVPDPELGELYWFKLAQGAFVLPGRDPVARWEIMT